VKAKAKIKSKKSSIGETRCSLRATASLTGGR
jgi:hypothetical protein